MVRSALLDAFLAAVRLVDSAGYTALHWLLDSDTSPGVEHLSLLLRPYPGAAMIAEAKRGYTPLHLMCVNSNAFDCEQYPTLLGVGVRPAMVKARSGDTPLHVRLW